MTIATEAGHWYLPNHQPYYTYINKNGEEKNVTLREARKVNAAPSVSMIANCASAYQLEQWKLKQIARLCRDNPVLTDEDEAAHEARILSMFRDEGDTVMGLGSEIHGAIEKALTDTVWIPRPEASATIQTLGKWCGLDGLRPERSFYHQLGYGGKCDVHKTGFVADFKTKAFSEDDMPLRAWDNHAMQLTAYRHGFNMPDARCAIIFISTSIPGLTQLVEVSQDELAKGWEMFKALLAYWQAKNRYKPAMETAC